jgi:hypothetical protein
MRLTFILLFVCFTSFGQMDKVKTHHSTLTKQNIINNNFDSLDTRITTLIDSGSVRETVEFTTIEYDTVKSQFGYIIWSLDSCWIERPKGTYIRRLDE